MAIQMGSMDFRTELADTLNKVTYADELVEITRRGRTIAYVISAERYERLTRNLDSGS